METYDIAHLIPCKDARFVSTFLPHMNSKVPAYVAKIPTAMDLSKVAAILLNEKDIEVLSTYETREYFQEIHEIILVGFEHGLTPLIVGRKETLQLMQNVITATSLLPYNLSFFDAESKKRDKFRYCFFTLEEGGPYYYEFEPLSMSN